MNHRRHFLSSLLASGAGSLWLAQHPGHLLLAAEDDAKKDDRNGGKPEHPFLGNVKVTVTDAAYIVISDGIPDHKTGEFPNRDNPNRIQKQNYRFTIPRQPKKAKEITKLPMGPIGVAINGIPFYNPFNIHGKDAVEGEWAEVFDACCGHPDQRGRYHYHKYPVCVKSPFKETKGEHSPLIGFAFDGFAIYGPNSEGGKPPTDLDECNGHEDRDNKERGYHYHVSTKFPYILGGYRGEVERANFDRRPLRDPYGKGPPPKGPPPKRD